MTVKATLLVILGQSGFATHCGSHAMERETFAPVDTIHQSIVRLPALKLKRVLHLMLLPSMSATAIVFFGGLKCTIAHITND